MKRTGAPIFLACFLAALNAASIAVVYRGASAEPYVSFRPSDAMIQVGVGTALIVLWVLVVIGLSCGVLSGHCSRLWLLSIFWAAILLFYLYESPAGYIEDISRYAAR